MTASEHLSPKLFHGTGGAIKGGVVKRSEEGVHGPGAYASTSEHVATSYAEGKAQEQGRLFGTVYRVQPISQMHEVIRLQAHDVIRDYEGLKVVEPVSHPINPDVDQGLVIGKHHW